MTAVTIIASKLDTSCQAIAKVALRAGMIMPVDGFGYTERLPLNVFSKISVVALGLPRFILIINVLEIEYQYPSPPEPISQPLSWTKLTTPSSPEELINEVSVGC